MRKTEVRIFIFKILNKQFHHSINKLFLEEYKVPRTLKLARWQDG